MAAGKSFAGFHGGNRVQDAAVQMSSGPVHDREGTPGARGPGDHQGQRVMRVWIDQAYCTGSGLCTRKILGINSACDLANDRGKSTMSARSARHGSATN